MRYLTELKNLAQHVWTHPANKGGRIAALSRLVYWQVRKRLTGRPMVIWTVCGNRFKVMPDSKYSSLVYYTRLPDWEEMNFLLEVLRVGDGFVDIGANVGFYTILAAAKVHPKDVHAFEPNPANIAVLKDQLELNALSDVKIYPYALADRAGLVNFGGSDRETGSITTSKSASSYHVHAGRLDALLGDFRLPAVTVAKLDVEGGELAVLGGAGSLIAEGRIAIWIFEASEENQASAGHTVEDVFTVFRRNGYEFYRWSVGDRRLVSIHPSQGNAKNIIACHSSLWLDERFKRIA